MQTLADQPNVGPAALSPAVRHETKFVFPSHYIDFVLQLLEHRCARDPGHFRNTIHSLYYDTPQLDSVNEKDQSEYLKCKVRLRWYTGDDPSESSPNIYLEIKRKEGCRSFKKRFCLPIDADKFSRNPIVAGEDLHLSEWLDEESGAEFRNMVPVCVIHYVRCRFVDMATGGRIALDRNIGVAHPNPRLRFPGYAGTLDSSVLEVKGERVCALPSTLVGLQTLGVRKTSFSKYAECVNTLLLRGG
jgi:hypothetical protein